ncbi:unnamed protein product [Cochlearia groenlandica]
MSDKEPPSIRFHTMERLASGLTLSQCKGLSFGCAGSSVLPTAEEVSPDFIGPLRLPGGFGGPVFDIGGGGGGPGAFLPGGGGGGGAGAFLAGIGGGGGGGTPADGGGGGGGE